MVETEASGYSIMFNSRINGHELTIYVATQSADTDIENCQLCGTAIVGEDTTPLVTKYEIVEIVEDGVKHSHGNIFYVEVQARIDSLGGTGKVQCPNCYDEFMYELGTAINDK